MIDYLDGVDPAAATRARRRYGCFEEFGGDQDYGRAVTFGVSESCRLGAVPKIVVWEHNSHIGDARMTEMGRRGEHNLGQLTRERLPDGAFLVGFTTYVGTVTAASAWDAPAERKVVRAALPESYEALFHSLDEPRFLIDLASQAAAEELLQPRLERAIGVIYRPETERQSHYFGARLAAQFDAVIHIDETRAVEPLERTAGWEVGEPPETYPSAL
ncbi:MAG TPA: erythromycin esterase family protein [Solirubrobacterales bacterium]|nr:erythromycin esterase family protein [Solirubrobacterales bacterium]